MAAYPLLDKKLDALRKAESDSLRINFDRITGQDIERVAQAIHTAPFLTELHFMGGPLNTAATHLFAQAIASRTDIQEFGWTSNAGQDENLAQVIDALENSPKLKSLYVTWSEAGDKTAEAVARRIDANPDFENLFASGAAWSQESHDRLAESVKNKESLVTFNTSARKHPLDDTKLGAAFTEHYHPNLIVPTGCHMPGVEPLKDKNNAACERARDEVAEIEESLSQKEFNTAISAQFLADAMERTPALVNFGAFKRTNLDKFQALTASLPTVADKATLPELFAANETGFSAIENPDTWKQRPNLLQELQAAGALDNDSFTARTSKGNTLMDLAVLHRPLEEVLPVFNAQGLKIQKDSLIDADGQPTKLLERLNTRGDLPAVFTEANWTGASPKELLATVAALPEAIRSQVPPLNSLQQTLRAGQQSRAGIGR